MFKIKHNPFSTTDTAIFIKDIKTNQEKFSKLKDFRFQDIVDEIPEEFDEEANEETIHIHFVGRTFEYEDLDNACNEYMNKSDVKFTLTHEVKYDHIDIEKIKALSNVMKTSPIEEIRDQKSINSFLAKLNNEFDIVVVATVSSGKSTLINAMMGDSILPAGNEATTAKIYYIKDEDGAAVFKSTVYDNEENIIEQCDSIEVGYLDKFNKNEDVFRIEIEGDLPNISSEVMNLVLIDTPGTNNSQDERHEETTFKLIKDDENNPIVLFVLDATKPRVKDEHILLNAISKEIKKKNSQQARDRFIFVLNKSDRHKKGELEKAIIDYRSFLETNYEITNAKIFPLAAEEALIVRKLQQGAELDIDDEEKVPMLKLRTENEKYKYKYFEQYAPISSYERSRIQNSIDQAKAEGDWQTQALHHSGITALEMVIDDYVNKYAIPIKVKEAFKKIDNLVLIEELEANLIKEMDVNNDKLADYEKNLIQIREQLGKRYHIKNFKKKIKIITIDQIPIKKEREKIVKEFNNLYKDDLFTKNLDSIIANEKIESSITKITTLRANIKAELESQLNSSIKTKSNEIIDSFKKEIESLFDTNNLSTLSLSNKELVLASLPSGNDLKEKVKTIETKTVVTGKKEVERTRKRKKDFFDSWWVVKLGALRSDDETYFIDVPITKKVHKRVTDYQKVKEQFMEINDNLLDAVVNYEKEANAELTKLKDEAKQIGEDFTEILKKRLKEQDHLIKDKDAIIKKKKNHKKQEKWLNEYKYQKEMIYKTIRTDDE